MDEHSTCHAEGAKRLKNLAGKVFMDQYYVYIMSSYRGTLYVGVTNDLARRVHQHRSDNGSGFTKKYNVTKLVYYEATSDVYSAIAREKQIKGWVRRKKVELIESMNPGWTDLSDEWADRRPSPPDPSLCSG